MHSPAPRDTIFDSDSFRAHPARKEISRGSSVKARDELARTLSEVAGDMEVPALKEAINDFDAREMARFALDRMTCQAATDALADAALNAVGVEFRIGVYRHVARQARMLCNIAVPL